MKRKVRAYILRKNGGNTEVLTFSEPEFPEAGVQVPGGTIEWGESELQAIVRGRFIPAQDQQSLDQLRKIYREKWMTVIK